jgi:hypothetical protein
MSDVVDLKDFKKKKAGETHPYLICDCGSIFYAVVLEPPDLILICANCDQGVQLKGRLIDGP